MDYTNKELKEFVSTGVFTAWQEVSVEILRFTNTGIKVAINNEYIGLVYKNEIYDNYEKGEIVKAYIKCIRKDGRIDVSLQPNTGKHLLSTHDKIMAYLKAAGGKSRYNDKSSSEDIKYEFQISKTVFKRAIGNLYKQGKIKISDQGIELI